jgi:hypothetical protein
MHTYARICGYWNGVGAADRRDTEKGDGWRAQQDGVKVDGVHVCS